MSYKVPNDPSVIVQELGLNLTKDQLRKLESAVSLAQENDRSIENFLGLTTQKIPLVAEEPTIPSDGDMWINTTLNELHVRMAGVTRRVTVT